MVHFVADLAVRHRIEVLVEDQYWTTCKCIEGVDERGEAYGIAVVGGCGRLRPTVQNTTKHSHILNPLQRALANRFQPGTDFRLAG